MNSENKHVSVVLSPEVYQQLSLLARDSYRTMSGYIRHLIHLHLRELEAQK